MRICEFQVAFQLVDIFLLHIYFQKIIYTADMEHSGKKLHCIYEQRDDEGNNLFEGNQDDEDDVLIIVRYLEETSDEVETLPSAEVRISEIIDWQQ